MLRNIVISVIGGILTLTFGIILALLLSPAIKVIPNLAPLSAQIAGLALIITAILAGWLAAMLSGVRGLRALIPSFGVGIVAAFLIGFIVLLLLKGIGNPLIFGWRGMIFVLWSAILGGALFVRGHALVFSSLSFILICLISFLTYQDYEYITGTNGIYSQNLTISSENIILGATITIPSNIKEKLPGVVLIPGSGPQDRDETFGLHNATFREIALFLSQNGFVVLRYDKRGAGSSSGVFTESGLYDFAKDAENAFLYLKSRPEVDSSKVFLLGHSYGGKVATIVASRHPETAGLILLACVASKEPDNILRQNQFIAYAKGMNTKERKKHFEDLKAWFNGVKNNKYQYYEDYFGPDGLAEKLQKTQKVNPIPPIWLKQAMEYDQLKTLSNLHMSVLVLSGNADWLVPPSETKLLQKTLKEANYPDYKVKIFPGLDHRFTKVKSMKESFRLMTSIKYLFKRYPVDLLVLETILTWLKNKSSVSSFNAENPALNNGLRESYL